MFFFWFIKFDLPDVLNKSIHLAHELEMDCARDMMFAGPTVIVLLETVPNCSYSKCMDCTLAVLLEANGHYCMAVDQMLTQPLHWLAVKRWRCVNSIGLCPDPDQDHDDTLVHHNLVLAIGRLFECRHCRSTHRLRQNSLGYQSIVADEAAVAMIVSNKCC